MAHQLEITEDGQVRMFYAGEMPWHRLGTQVEREITAEAAIRLAGLDWVVEKMPIMIAEPITTAKGDIISDTSIDTHKAIVRKEDGKMLGIVGKSYEPIQNSEAFGFMDALVGEGLAMYHAAGSLFGGRQIFITCKMPDSVQVGPDQIDKFLVLATGHDGGLALHVKWTPIRVICWNTMSAAFSIHGGKVHAQDCVSIKHTLHYQDRVTEAREVLGLTDIYYKRLEECFNKLLATPMTAKDFKSFGKVLYPDIEDKEHHLVTPKSREKVRRAIGILFEKGIGNDHPDVKNTRWAALNAITEFVDHHKGFRTGKDKSEEEVRMSSIIWGDGSQVKKRAMQLLVKN